MRRLEAFVGFNDAVAAQANLNQAFIGVGYDVVIELMEVTRGFLAQEPKQRDFDAFLGDIRSRTQDPSLIHRRGLALVQAFETNEEVWNQQLDLRSAAIRTLNQQAAANI